MIKGFFGHWTAACLLLLAGILSSGCGPEDTIHDPTIITTQGHTRAPLPPLNPNRPKYTKPLPGSSGGWAPPSHLEQSGRWEGILIHHTATLDGNAAKIDRVHKDMGWDGLGYHFVIDNGNGGKDGQIEVGWRWQKQREGAHCRVRANDNNYWNEHTIGIVLVGNFEKTKPTAAQYESLAKLVNFLRNRYNIPLSKIKGHGDVDNTKCPGRNFDFNRFFALLKTQQNYPLAK